MDGLHRHLHAAEREPAERPRGLVVVARHIDDRRALVRHLQETPQHRVVRVRPVPALLQPPHVDDVADEIDRIALDMLEEARKLLGLRAVRPEVAVADEECPVSRLHASNLDGVGATAAVLATGRPEENQRRVFRRG